jgi:hypothetical protein
MVAKRYLITGLGLLSYLGTLGQSQVTSRFSISVNQCACIRVYPVKTIRMSLLCNNAGEPMGNKIDNSTYMQLTTILPIAQSRKLTAKITAGTLPLGTLLKLTATPCTTGDGNFGNCSSITLNKTSAQTIITNIGCCYTGNTTTSGYNLVYSFEPDPLNISKLFRSSARTITITYTITGN